jgi:putative IMPACT (imprinted ancient) family translation regulator
VTTTLATEARFQQEVRKSRFVAHAAPVTDIDAALVFIARAADRSATHNCWAYRIGAQYRFNDDGEPGGTAGKPILQAIDGQSIDHVAVVVTRWFGGIKLGAGGLARGYGGVAAECLRLAPKSPLVVRVCVTVHMDFAAAASLRARLGDHDAVKKHERSDADGVELALELPQERIAGLAAFVRDITRGRGRLIEPPGSEP